MLSGAGADHSIVARKGETLVIMRIHVHSNRRLFGHRHLSFVALLVTILTAASITPGLFRVQPAAAATTIVGYGQKTVGGTGGQHRVVTSLADSGAGTLRDAIAKAKASTGPDIITFGVAGTLSLRSDLTIDFPYLTIDGSTAPAQGVQITGGMFKVAPPAHNIIFHYLKVRPGDTLTSSLNDDRDAITLNGLKGRVSNIVIDHATLIWGPDIGGLSILGNVEDVTVQYTIMGEGLFLSKHYEGTTTNGGHSMGASMFQLDPAVQPARRVTLYKNLYTSSDRRMPIIQGAEQVDLVNNVIYNWRRNAPGGNPRSINVVGNVMKAGPQTTERLGWAPRPHQQANPTLYAQSVYESGNLTLGFSSMRGAASTVYRATPAAPVSVQPVAAQTAYADVLANVGATLPVRDRVDQRIVANVQNGTMVHPNGSQPGRYINGADLIWPNLTVR
jgi:pectate lyase